ncbi:wax ester synthase/diacylglycerol acyltransferase 11-like isoform X2 [Phragmites australis]|uniref:wax ester synthase/diacylglycerol acyltransferase 11-like isoform X2 n=1 Tax=Phragmites australis TaxID=29695 RepID=UPI002D79BA9F|nr:wax ester synthase/diacylglycerol acyltransferase 11-like isoform X2 [Phragmites australis]
MDPGATADPAGSTTSTLRKRLASLDTSRAGDGSREPAPRPKRVSKARQEETSMAPAEEQAEAAGRDVEAGEPMSPAGRLFRETHFNCYIVAVIGLGAAVDIAAARAGLEATLVRHQRFCSIQVEDDVKKKAKPRWVRTTVDLDNHIIFPNLDPTATSANPDQVVEDYLSSLSTEPMDHSRPLWELHVLDFPTSEATATVAIRMHHSLGDGISLLSLLIACTRSAADPARLPELPPAPRRTGPVHARPRPPLSAGLVALLVWAWSYVVLAWHTLVDVVRFVATAWFLRDARTPFMGSEGVEFHRKRFVHRTLSLDDVKFVKNAMKCSVNDVLVGVTNAGLSRYYFRKAGDANSTRKKSQKRICVRSALLVNIRKSPGLHALAEMMDPIKHNDAKWGNLIGYIILPFLIAMHDDPLEYIREGKRAAERKKTSFEAVFTYWSGNLIVKLFGIKHGRTCREGGVLWPSYRLHCPLCLWASPCPDCTLPKLHELCQACPRGG